MQNMIRFQKIISKIDRKTKDSWTTVKELQRGTLDPAKYAKYDKIPNIINQDMQFSITTKENNYLSIDLLT